MKTLAASFVGVLLAFAPASVWSDSVPAGIERLGWTLVHSVWQLTAVAVIAALVDRALRCRSADARYIASVTALGLMVTLPCVTWMLVAVEPHRGHATIATAPDAAAWRAGGVSLPVETSLGSDSTGGLTPSARQSARADDRLFLRDRELSSAAIGSTDDERVGTESQPTGWQRMLVWSRVTIEPRLPLLVALWIAGVVLCSLRPAWGLWTQSRLRRVGLSPVSETAQHMLLDLTRRMRLTQVVRIAESTFVRVPMVVGYLRPMILLPASVLTGLTPTQLEAVLAHELAHVRRHDWLINALQVLAETLLFYHPAVWWLSNRIRHERELCCDDFALSLINDKAVFARTLLILEELRQSEFTPALAATGGDLAHRVRRLLPTAQVSRQPTHGAGATVLVTLCLSLALFFGVSTASRQTAATESPPRAGRGSPDPALTPTAGLPNSDEETNPTNNANGDLRSNPAAGSGDPRPARDGGAEREAAKTYKCRVVEYGTKAPIAEAKVVVRPSVDDSSKQKLLPQTVFQTTTHTTDENGYYEITFSPEQLAVEDLWIDVGVSHGRYVAKPLSGDWLSAVHRNEQRGDRPFFELIELSSGKEVTGTVVSPTGEPMPKTNIFFVTFGPPSPDQWLMDETQTDNAGRFHIRLVTPGEGAFWILSNDYAPLRIVAPAERGDLGMIKLKPGFQPRGQVLDLDDRPLAKLRVTISREGSEFRANDEFNKQSGPAVYGYRREAITDAEGRFTLLPVEAGTYRLEVVGHKSNDLFPDRRVTLTDDSPPLELRPVATVAIHVRNVDSAGRPVRGKHTIAPGTFESNGFAFFSDDPEDGRSVVRVPRGSKDVRLDFVGGLNTDFRIRRQPGAPLENIWSFQLGDVTNDVTGIEVVRYQSPIVFLKAVDAAGKPIEGIKAEIVYSAPKPVKVTADSFVQEDVELRQQTDGRWRSLRFLPDEDITVSVTKDGWQTEPQKVRLKEGEERELVFVLRSNPAAGPGDTSRAQAKQRDIADAPLEFRFLVVDSKGEPVAGAKVTPWGISHTWFSSLLERKWCPEVTTDDKGRARVTLSKEQFKEAAADRGQAGQLPTIHSLALRVDHPQHPIWSQYVQVADPARVVLVDVATIEVRPRRRNDDALLHEVIPVLNGYDASPAEWLAMKAQSQKEGILTIRRVDLSSKEAVRWLRLVHVPKEGPAWFSDLIDLKPLDAPISLNPKLRPGARVNGRLTDAVPRPINNGRVVATIMGGGTDAWTWRWTLETTIGEDGSFVFESVPPHENLQLIALCDGWVSRSPTVDEMTAYAKEYDFDTAYEGGDGFVYPQVFRTMVPTIEPVLKMVRTANCEVTVVDEAGQPIGDATVDFWPNQLWFHSGSNILGTGHDSLKEFQTRLQTGEPPKPWPQNKQFEAKTNARGIAVVKNLPVSNVEPLRPKKRSFDVSHDDYEVPLQGGNVDRAQSVDLTLNQLARVMVKMTAKKANATNAARGAPAGLPNADEDTNPTNNTNGDLRSNPAAGSGDPRRAQLSKAEELELFASRLRSIAPRDWVVERKDRAFRLRGPDVPAGKERAQILLWFDDVWVGSSDALAKRDKSLPKIGNMNNTRIGRHYFTRNTAAEVLWPEFGLKVRLIEPVDQIAIATADVRQSEVVSRNWFDAALVRYIEIGPDGRRLSQLMNLDGSAIGITAATKFLVVGKLPNPQTATNEADRGSAFRHLKTFDELQAEAKRHGVRIISLADFERYTESAVNEGRGFRTRRIDDANKLQIPECLTTGHGLVVVPLAESQTKVDTAPPDGLDFLKPYPKLHGLSLNMTEPQFLEIVKRQELKTRKTFAGEKVTHRIALGDGHTLIVMFDKDAKCSGIQRVRGEDKPGELEPFQGTWTMDLCDSETKAFGDSQDVVKNWRWAINGNEIVWSRSKDEVWKLAFAVDPTKSPKEIDLTFLDGPHKGEKCLGMYEWGGVNKKMLLMSVQDPGAKVARPKSISMKADGQTSLIFLEPMNAEKELASLQGTWKFEIIQTDGWPKPIGKGPDRLGRGDDRQWVIKGNEITWTSPDGEEVKLSFTINPTKSPKHFDVTFLNGPHKGQRCLGMYERGGLGGVVLWLCLTDPGSQASRPTRVSYSTHEGRTMIGLIRDHAEAQ